MNYLLSFEKSLEPLYKELEERKKNLEATTDIEEKIQQELEKIYANLTAYQIAQIARHPDRPNTTDYINTLFEDFIELHGDRKTGDDPSIIAGLGSFNGTTVTVIGSRKGNTLKEMILCNRGMIKPEGFRKIARIVNLASTTFKSPIITFIDTPGAFVSRNSEKKGQIEAVSEPILALFKAKVPVIAVIIGEGVSLGALSMSIANKIIMLKYSFFSVISPEGGASILYNNKKKTEELASSLKFTAADLLNTGVIDKIVNEPTGGAHRNKEEVIKTTGDVIHGELETLLKENEKQLKTNRIEKYRKIGIYAD
jgi:acetyl-CoA carboxylase carboxyl transferase subunit alpha